jgi:uncharacterized protein with HEPN domain
VSRSNGELIANAREHLDRLKAHLRRGDLDDDAIFDAVCMRLSAAIESISGIDVALRDKAFGNDWPIIWSVRNRIAHGYVFVDRTIVSATVSQDVAQLERALDELEGSL